jgi:hypothetical protein
VVAAAPGVPSDAHYDSACVAALASAAANNPDAAHAVEPLRQAVAKGYGDVPHMLKDADLAALRRRDDYAALLWDLADGLLLPRVVGGVDVGDVERAGAVDLDDGFALGPREVAHLLGHAHERAGR